MTRPRLLRRGGLPRKRASRARRTIWVQRADRRVAAAWRTSCAKSLAAAAAAEEEEGSATSCAGCRRRADQGAAEGRAEAGSAIFLARFWGEDAAASAV